MEIIGQRNVFVKEANQYLRLIVVSEKIQVILIEREWLKQLKLDYSRLFSIKNLNNESNRNSLMDSYADLFNKDLGCLKDVRINFNLKKDMTPVFCKARSLPIFLKNKVENEIDRLVNSDILEPIVHAYWAAPIVSVLEKDGSVRICGDFRCTANKAIESDRHSLSLIDEIFSKLSTSTVLSTRDLSRAYLQKPKRAVVDINTTKGLFSYKRLPYCVAVAPNKFQRIMEGIFADLPGVACYIDDILVAGKEFVDHKQKLDLVFRRLLEKGFKIDKYGLHSLENKESSVRESLDEDQSMPRIKSMPPATISEWTWAETPWHRLHLDLADIISKRIISHLREIFTRFGLPEFLVTDNGRQFVFGEFEQFTKMNGIRHTKPSPYNPSTNGLGLYKLELFMVIFITCVVRPLNGLLKMDSVFYWNQKEQHAFKAFKSALICEPALGHFDYLCPT
ncbi:hypothetical protein LAZ67_X003079 [Cordylochernes scorpioides]|uniref:Integrase catalytic domain-containing protein n=1 Tax=Cordylochernes scorpioides TaxID=51811 RepID=A0ABY6LWD7_9ARAC|nr:hypothetical protein LAZ67_X003079 [Cordylochernes scorpioides]